MANRRNVLLTAAGALLLVCAGATAAWPPQQRHAAQPEQTAADTRQAGGKHGGEAAYGPLAKWDNLSGGDATASSQTEPHSPVADNRAGEQERRLPGPPYEHASVLQEAGSEGLIGPPAPLAGTSGSLTQQGGEPQPDSSLFPLRPEQSGQPQEQEPTSGPVWPKSGAKASRPKTAYLTFDDGPSDSTAKILDILQRYEAKATFFVIGNETEEGKRMYRRIAAEGHVLGNHTYSHDYSRIYRSVDAFEKDLARLDELLADTVGIHPDIYRFPGGSNNHQSRKYGGRNVMEHITREMSKRGQKYVDWNVSSTDAAAAVLDKESIIRSVYENSRGKSDIIVLMHDTSRKTTTVQALPVIIEHLREEGYTFRTLTPDSFGFQFLKS